MKKVLIIICLAFLIISCTAGHYETTKLYVNGQESGVPDALVIFYENDVYVPIMLVLNSMGGENAGQFDRVSRGIQIQEKVFHYDIQNHVLLLETVPSSQPIVLLSEQNEARYVDWLDGEIFMDYTTLKNILDAAGIPVEIRVDWENERIYIDTLEAGVSRGRFS